MQAPHPVKGVSMHDHEHAIFSHLWHSLDETVLPSVAIGQRQAGDVAPQQLGYVVRARATLAEDL